MISTYPAVYIGSMLAAVLATPLVVRLARRFDILDRPDPRKVHRVPIPRIGGVAIVIAMLAGALPGYLIDGDIRHAFNANQSQIITLLAAGFAIFIVGLLDDVLNLPSKIKLIALILAALAVCYVDVRIGHLRFGNIVDRDIGWVSWPLTVLWIVAVTVAINFIDGLDGLAAGIAAIACGVIAVFAANNQNSILIIPSLALLGALTGFLFFNFNPAKIFMGDSGSMFIGFMLAVTSIQCQSKKGVVMGLALPAMALGIPLFDTFITMIRRGVLQRRSIFSAEKGHIHHRLIDTGMEHRNAVLMLYGATLVLAGLGVLTLYTDDRGLVLILGAGVVLVLLFFRRAGGMKLWETFVAMRRNAAINRDQKAYRNIFEQSQLRLANAFTFDDWWRETYESARGLQFRRLTVPLTNRDGLERVMEWTSGPMPGPQQTITVTVPIRHRRAGSPLRGEAEVAVLDSLESAGARVTFFIRLMEEHCVAALPSADAVKAAQKKLAAMPALPMSSITDRRDRSLAPSRREKPRAA